MPSKRVRDAEIRVRNRPLNGPLRVQGKCLSAEYNATCGHTSVAGNMSVFRKAHGFAVNQGGTANKAYSSLTDFSLSGTFILQEELTMDFNGVNFDTYFNNYPDKDGYFGKYGGVYVDDKLKAAMAEITEAYYSNLQSRKFIAELAETEKSFRDVPLP